MSRLTIPAQMRPIGEFIELFVVEAAAKAEEMKAARARRKRKRVGSTIRPGDETPLWNELRRHACHAASVRGEQAKLARILGLARQEVNAFLTAGTRMPDAERTLMIVAWLSAKRDGRPLS